MQNDKPRPSSNDKTTGWIFMVIGILGILYAAVASYDLHNSLPNYTIGLMLGGFLIRSLIPLLFIASGEYYLSGKNALKKQKKAGIVNASLQSQDAPAQAPVANSFSHPGSTVIAPTTPNTDQSQNSTPPPSPNSQ